MHTGRLAAGLASLGLAAAIVVRIAMAVGGAAVAMSCGSYCGIGPISPSTLPDGQVGKAYFLQLHVAPSDAACSDCIVFRRIDGGALPQGMKLSVDGAIDGTPLRSGEYRFAVGVDYCQGDQNARFDPDSESSYTLTILP